MVEEAKEHESEDKSKRELIDARNQADQLHWATEKALKEHGDKVSAGDRGKIESALNNLKQVKDGDDIAAIRRAMEEVTAASEQMGKAIYEKVAAEQAAAAGAAGAGAGEASGSAGKGEEKAEGKVVDADFEVVDDDK